MSEQATQRRVMRVLRDLRKANQEMASFMGVLLHRKHYDDLGRFRASEAICTARIVRRHLQSIREAGDLATREFIVLMKSLNPREPVDCPICGKTCHNQFGLEQHMKMKHGITPTGSVPYQQSED